MKEKMKIRRFLKSCKALINKQALNYNSSSKLQKLIRNIQKIKKLWKNFISNK